MRRLSAWVDTDVSVGSQATFPGNLQALIRCHSRENSPFGLKQRRSVSGFRTVVLRGTTQASQPAQSKVASGCAWAVEPRKSPPPGLLRAGYPKAIFITDCPAARPYRLRRGRPEPRHFLRRSVSDRQRLVPLAVRGERERSPAAVMCGPRISCEEYMPLAWSLRTATEKIFPNAHHSVSD